MAIQPIDLQALFTQVEKVGKLQSNQREGLQIQQALQQVDSQKKAEAQVQSVNEAQDMGDEAEKIKDGNAQRQNPNSSEGKKEPPEEEEEAEEEKDDPSLIRDPTLGRNIDISG
jgi:DNA-directed RNA polymerase alpha subunit